MSTLHHPPILTEAERLALPEWARDFGHWGLAADGSYRSPYNVPTPAPARPPDVADIHAHPRALDGVVPRWHAYLDYSPVSGIPRPRDIAQTIAECGAGSVVLGDHAVNCWIAEARATFTLEVRGAPAHRQAIARLLAERYPSLHQRLGNHLIIGEVGEFRVHIHCLDSSLMDLVASTALSLVRGHQRISIACPEALIALACLSIRQSAIGSGAPHDVDLDIMRLANRLPLRIDLLDAYSALISPDDTELLRQVVHQARLHSAIVAACRR